MLEQIKKHWYLYVLLCENNKYYIGIALDLTKRIDTHFRQLSGAAMFCKKHKPKKILDRKDLGFLIQHDAELLEDIETCNYIDKYGFNNVCGGCFSPYRKIEQYKGRYIVQLNSVNYCAFIYTATRRKEKILKNNAKYIDTKNFIETYNQFHKDDCSGFDNDESATKALSVISQLRK